MPLETFTNSEVPLNIKNISAETPEHEPRLRFDPKRDVTEEDWRGLQGRLSDYRRAGDWRELISLASCISQLDQLRTPQLSGSDWEEITDSAEKSRRKGKWLDFLDETASIARLDKTKIPSISETDWHGIGERVAQNKELTFWSNIIRMIANIASIDRTRIPLITDEEWREIVELSKNRGLDWQYMIMDLVSIATIDSTRLPTITDDNWQNMRHHLDWYRRENRWHQFGPMAANLSILARLEAGVNHGHHLASSETPDLPQIRKF